MLKGLVLVGLLVVGVLSLPVPEDGIPVVADEVSSVTEVALDDVTSIAEEAEIVELREDVVATDEPTEVVDLTEEVAVTDAPVTAEEEAATETVQEAEERVDVFYTTFTPDLLEERSDDVALETESTTEVAEELIDDFETTDEPELAKERSGIDFESATDLPLEEEEVISETTFSPETLDNEVTAEERMDVVSSTDANEVSELDLEEETESTTLLAEERIDTLEVTESPQVAEERIDVELTTEEQLDESVTEEVVDSYLRSNLNEEDIDGTTSDLVEETAVQTEASVIDASEIELKSEATSNTDAADEENSEITTEISVTSEKSVVRKSSSTFENAATIELVEIKPTVENQEEAVNEGAEIAIVEVTDKYPVETEPVDAVINEEVTVEEVVPTEVTEQVAVTDDETPISEGDAVRSEVAKNQPENDPTVVKDIPILKDAEITKAKEDTIPEAAPTLTVESETSPDASEKVAIDVEDKMSQVAEKYGLTKIEQPKGEVVPQENSVYDSESEDLQVAESNSIQRRMTFGSKLSQYY